MLFLACLAQGVAWAGLPAPTTPTALPVVALTPDQAPVLRLAAFVPGGEQAPGTDAPWRAITLPHRWADTHPGYEGSMWYRFAVRLDQIPIGIWAIYLPRAVTNAQVWVNGVAMAYVGSMSPPVTRNWYVPQLVQVPAAAWLPGDNVIQVRLASGYVTRNGLSPIQVGPIEHLEGAFKLRTLAQVDGVLFANIALIALGCFLVIVWLRDREQLAIGYMGWAAVFWGFGTSAMIAPNPLTDLVLWEVMAYVSTVWSQLMVCLFFFHFSGRSRGWLDRGVYALMLVTVVCALVVPSTGLTAAIYACIYTFMLWGIGEACWAVMHQRRRDGWLLLAGCAVLIPAGAHDVLFQLNQLPFDTIYWLPFVGPIMQACIFYILAGDYARSRRSLTALNADLADRVARRELELRKSFERLAALEQAQAVSAERSRILRDMHDGVGAHLTSALRQLQSPRQHDVDLALVTQTLRDSLDQLKLSIDALSLPAGDVVGLLASLRFRLTPRLKAAGLELVWDVEDLPPWPAGQAPVLRQLQYILFEGLSNVLQHSGANRLILSARDRRDHIQVALIDNGRGWLPAGPTAGQGVQTMRARAHVIGARLEFITPAQGGVELRLTLPLSKVHESDLSSTA